MQLCFDRFDSVIGGVELVSDGARLCALDFADHRERMLSLLRARYGEVRLTRKSDPCRFSTRVRAYLDGHLHALDGIPVDTETGGTAFQRSVWNALREIPLGTTTTYGDLAERIGRPGSARAVGLANSRNPIALVLPCHRVVGADGTLTGYAGGLERKRWLLAHEGAVDPAMP